MSQINSKVVLRLLVISGICLFVLAIPLNLQTQAAGKLAIARVWEGRTPIAKADGYERYLNQAGVPTLTGTAGNLGMQILRRPTTEAVEFVVISYWDSRESIKKLVGEDIEKAFSLPRDSEFLIEPVTTVRHYQVVYSKYQ